jgi:hypothetical protein
VIIDDLPALRAGSLTRLKIVLDPAGREENTPIRLLEPSRRRIFGGQLCPTTALPNCLMPSQQLFDRNVQPNTAVRDFFDFRSIQLLSVCP